MNKYWLRLGQTDAISRVTLIVVVLLQTSGGLLTSIVDTTGRVPEFVLIRVAALSSIFLVLGVGKLILRSSLSPRIKPIVTVLVFICASMLNVFVDDSLLVATGLIPESRFFTRLAISIYGLPVAMIATGLVVSQLREFAATNLRLAKIEQSLMASREDAEKLLASRKVELMHRIEKEITEGVSAINSQNTELSSQQMKTLLDDVVRPMSYQLDREIPSISVDVAEVIDPKVKWRSVFLSTINDANPFHPIATVAWPTVTITTFIVAAFGPIGLLSGALFFAIFFFTTWLAQKLWNQIPHGISSTIKAIIITSLFAFNGLAASIAVIIPSNGLLLANGKIVAWIIFMVIIAWSIALVFTANRLLKSATQKLEATNIELKREVISLNNSLRQLQRGMSKVLHGPIQQAISASIYRLQTSTKDIDAPKLFEDIQKRISSSLELLRENNLHSRDLKLSFDELIEMWKGVATVTFKASEQDLKHIQTDNEATHAVYELVSEACVNAIKHGEPTQISVTINVDVDQKYIHIVKTSDGKPLLNSSKFGLGTQLLDEMCLSWKRFQQDEHVVLEMVVPLYDM